MQAVEENHLIRQIQDTPVLAPETSAPEVSGVVAASTMQNLCQSLGMAHNQIKHCVGDGKRKAAMLADEPVHSYWFTVGEHPQVQAKLGEAMHTRLDGRDDYPTDVPPLASWMVNVTHDAYTEHLLGHLRGNDNIPGIMYSTRSLGKQLQTASRLQRQSTYVHIDEQSYRTLGMVVWSQVVAEVDHLSKELRKMLEYTEISLGDPDRPLEGVGVSLSCRQIAQALQSLLTRLSTQITSETCLENARETRVEPTNSAENYAYVELARAGKYSIPASMVGLSFPGKDVFQDTSLQGPVLALLETCSGYCAQLLSRMDQV